MRTPPRLLIVEDDPMNLDILKTCLGTYGYEILMATDGEAGLAAAKKHRPDLAILDVMMPKMDGVEVCRRLKRDPTSSFMPIIILTARIDSQDIVAGLDAGADEYLTKPVDQAALAARVRSMLRIKELQDTTQEQAILLEARAAQLAAKNNDLQTQLLEEAKLAEIARLLGDIGHDVKNMMMPILMGVELLQNESKDIIKQLPPAQADKAREAQVLCEDVSEMVQSNARRIQDRVKEIGDAIKGRSSPPDFTSCQIQKVVTAVFNTLRLSAQQRKISLLTHQLDSLPAFQADESRLFNAFYNLVNNAIPETPPGGSVTVSGRVGSDADTVIISVADTGQGMPAEVRDSLFTKAVISRKPGGTGLGTKIVKDVVDAHGGSISVESQKGTGTTFRIVLPTEAQTAITTGTGSLCRVI